MHASEPKRETNACRVAGGVHAYKIGALPLAPLTGGYGGGSILRVPIKQIALVKLTIQRRDKGQKRAFWSRVTKKSGLPPTGDRRLGFLDFIKILTF